MTWFKERLISNRLMLFKAIFSAMKQPIYTIPRHCFCSVRACTSQGVWIANGDSTRKLKAMCVLVSSNGNLSP